MPFCGADQRNGQTILQVLLKFLQTWREFGLGMGNGASVVRTILVQEFQSDGGSPAFMIQMAAAQFATMAPWHCLFSSLFQACSEHLATGQPARLGRGYRCGAKRVLVQKMVYNKNELHHLTCSEFFPVRICTTE